MSQFTSILYSIRAAKRGSKGPQVGRLLGLLIAASATACTPGGDLPPLPEEPPAAYRLGPADVVRVITLGDQDLSAEFRVSDGGDIAVPGLGDIKAAGLTPQELQKRIADAFVAKRLFRNPNVSVEVTTYRPIFILGEVTKPGQYPYQPGMTVLTAVAVAGGFTYRAVDSSAAILRSVDQQRIEGRVYRQTLVEPGDVITVFERRF